VRSGFERAFAIGLAILLLVLALAAQLLQSGPESVAGSVASSGPEGRRALALLLRDLGVRAEAWNDAPASLPHDGALLWLAKAPSRTEGTEPSPADVGLRSLAHYRRFVEEGGTLLVPASDGARKFLVDGLGFTSCADAIPAPDPHAGTRSFRSASGETLEVGLSGGRVLAPLDDESLARVLWRGGTSGAEDEVFAVEVSEGRGRVVILGDDSFLDDAHLGEHDDAILAVRLAEEFAPGKHVLFDEYALGLWTPRTPIGILTSPSFFLASLHLLLLLALLVLRSAWVREFPRDPAPLESASPLLRARTLAALLARAGRYEVLAGWLKDGTGRRLDRRTRAAAAQVRELPRTTCRSADDLERLQRILGAIERSTP
jgi:hypothetical protein